MRFWRPLWLVPTALLLAGCGTFWINNTDELEGNVSIAFVNNTLADAVFTIGSWNELDRQGERPVDYLQPRINQLSRADGITLTCARNLAIGTQDLVDWMLLSEALDDADFDPALLNADVFFSGEAPGTPGFNAPTDGRATGLQLRLGLDYSCGDLIVFTFEDDPETEGGVRIDYEVIRDVDRNQ